MPYNRKAFGIVISKLRVQKGLTQPSRASERIG